MKLTTVTQVSVDGVVQGNGGRNENRSGGFERGGWARLSFDSEAMTWNDEVYQRADAFLLGRRTYELFARYWGAREDLDNPIVGALNAKPKYVASNTLRDPEWANTTVLSGDLATAVGELKAKPGGELQVHGSGTLVRSLLENDLVDEMNLLVIPVVVGQGMRLFPRTGPTSRLTWSNRGPSRKGSRSRSTGPTGGLSTRPTEQAPPVVARAYAFGAASRERDVPPSRRARY